MLDTRQEPGWQVFADTGGTFTDCLGIDSEGNTCRAKVLSNSSLRARIAALPAPDRVRLECDWDLPDDFFCGFGFRAGEERVHGVTVIAYTAASRELALSQKVSGHLKAGDMVELVSREEAPVLGMRVITKTPHGQPMPPVSLRLGSTRGTNAVLEEKGARVAFFVTQGFRDLLVIGDQKRPDLFAIDIRKPAPLYHFAAEVRERLDARGNVLIPLDLPALEPQIEKARKAGCTVAAVALMHSYQNPAHELALRQLLSERGFTYVACSAELAASIKYLPRAETAVIDAYIGPLMSDYLDRVESFLGGGRFSIMTSAGGLAPRGRYRSKDSLLSGPAGGMVGAVRAGAQAGSDKIIAFDMGGTSTDVSRYDGDFEYSDFHVVGRARLMAPALKIESVAAGGGSICWYDGESLRVGPESAGAHPGPACYGADGPLTITDVHLLLGRICAETFALPVYREKAESRFRELQASLKGPEPEAISREMMLQGLLDIANERMADAIRKISVREGYDPSGYLLVAFGGAGGLHACALADRLGMRRALFPADAGLLSARGLQQALLEAFSQRQLLCPLATAGDRLDRDFSELETDSKQKLVGEGCPEADIIVRSRTISLRLEGQETAIDIDYGEDANPAAKFEERYRSIYGYFPAGKKIEVVSVRVIASTRPAPVAEEDFSSGGRTAISEKSMDGYFRGEWCELSVFTRQELAPGRIVNGPAVIADSFSTLVVEPGWKAVVGSRGGLLLDRVEKAAVGAARESPEVVKRELFTQRYRAIVEEMGLQLQRTALSTNIKERQDFSCALLDSGGSLIVNAPHIPVHLGALGICVREACRGFRLVPGDVVVTNHPGCGGSHLPDITVITPVFAEDGKQIGYVANRAHHAEIGGMRPGSMPPGAVCLAEEGVVIPPMLLFKKGKARFEEIAALLSSEPYPTRAIEDNMSDLKAQVAANILGAVKLQDLVKTHGFDTVQKYLETIQDQADRAVGRRLRKLPHGEFSAREQMDDGTIIALKVKLGRSLVFDFSGTAPEHAGNLNATPAIVHSAVIYVLRLLVREDIPLNEGLMRNVRIILPRCFLNPDFSRKPDRSPAVAAGNIETSQRLVDTLLRALELTAGSQGTMNNVIFGDDTFSYYETIGGGSGASSKNDGASAVHIHMTNTAITDPEILEFRYPVRLLRFEVRRGSGGRGARRGGDGALRELEFLSKLSVSLLTQHRTEGPYGLAGGQPGLPGKQYVVRAGGARENLKAFDQFTAMPGDRLVIETPGGGGHGKAPDSS